MAEDLIKLAQTIAYVLKAMEHENPANELLITQGAYYQPTDSSPFTGNGIIQVVMRKYYVSTDAAYKLFDHARMMVEKSLRNDDIDSQGSATAADCFQEPQGIETSEWLDDFASMGYEVASVGLFYALWIPFANLTPDESLDGSF
ncbi:hypothetical protein J7337_010227 [Fusarium musae]|uniref:Uncharacterized protein n=1 Tax=Fusarium musae TaxID=1042133 RepID=A0A9P8D8W1_9HYPO|nr:hypothetical protein J7337_010227 [Fusarium musae]KAG9497367.1 hypothetical protein J7337_010227 [Fusarium musae]